MGREGAGLFFFRFVFKCPKMPPKKGRLLFYSERSSFRHPKHFPASLRTLPASTRTTRR